MLPFLLLFISCTNDDLDDGVVENVGKNEIEEISIQFASSILNINGTRSSDGNGLCGNLDVLAVNKIACPAKLTRAAGGECQDTAITVSFSNAKGTALLLKNEDNILPLAFFLNEKGIDLDKELNDSESDLSFLIQQTIAENSGKVSSVNSFKAETDLSIVEKLSPKCRVAWNQESPYNKYCPMVPYIDYNESVYGHGISPDSIVWKKKIAPAGCVAVAGAQALTVLQPNMNPPSCMNGVSWERIINASEWDGEEMDIIARLIKEVGDAVGMEYGADGSGAKTNRLSRLFAQYGIKDYDCERAIDVLKTKHGVIVISGFRSIHGWGPWKHYACGHAFIADGYIKYNEGEDPYYLHLNYGWGDGNSHRDAYVLSAKKSWKIEEARKEYKRQNIIYHYDTKYFTYAYTNEVNW